MLAPTPRRKYASLRIRNSDEVLQQINFNDKYGPVLTCITSIVDISTSSLRCIVLSKGPLLQSVPLVVAELCLTRLLRFKTFDTRYTVYTKQRDPRRPSCYTKYSGTTLVVNQKEDHIYEWKKPKFLRRCRRLNRSIHASIRSRSLTAHHHTRPEQKRSVAIK